MSSIYAHAGTVIGGTRVIYDGGKKESAISISNPGDSGIYLIQSWVDTGNPETKAPFIVTPPLFRIDPNEENILRIVYTGENLPKDRESIFWLNVKSIPSTEEKASENTLQIIVKSRVKVFYRPSKLSGKPIEAYQKLTFSRNGSQLRINNPTPYFVTFYSLKVDGKEVKEVEMVPPKETIAVSLPVGSASQVSWETINDYGGISKAESRPL